MKILHIHTALKSGGIETFVTSLANEQAALGHEVTVLSVFEPTGGCWDKISPLVRKETLGKIRPGFSIRYPILISRFIRRGNFDIVHVHGFLANYIWAILNTPKVRWFYTVHNDAYYEGNQWDRRFYRLKAKWFKSGRVHPVTISKQSEKSFEEYYGFSAPIIYNGIELKFYPKSQHNKYALITPARISRAKNLVSLCQAVHQLDAFRLTLCGQIQDQVIWQQLQPYLGHNIRYIGVVNDVPRQMSESGALLLPSLWEGMPITLLEAMSVGCIPICTAVGGIQDVIRDGENGIIIPSARAESIKASVLRYQGLSEVALEQMRAQAIQTAQQFSMTETAKQYLNLYEN